MHRDVKPHNVMIDHENRKVCLVVHGQIQVLMWCSYDLSTGVLPNSTTKGQNIMF